MEPPRHRAGVVMGWARVRAGPGLRALMLMILREHGHIKLMGWGQGQGGSRSPKAAGRRDRVSTWRSEPLTPADLQHAPGGVSGVSSPGTPAIAASDPI